MSERTGLFEEMEEAQPITTTDEGGVSRVERDPHRDDEEQQQRMRTLRELSSAEKEAEKLDFPSSSDDEDFESDDDYDFYRRREKLRKWKDTPVMVVGQVDPECEALVRDKKWDELERFFPRPEAEANCDITFSEPGEQVEVMKPLKTRILLVLAKEGKWSFSFQPVQSPKYTIEFQPSEGTLLHSESRAVIVDVTLTVMCTTTTFLQIPVEFWKDASSDFDEVVKRKARREKAFQCVLKSHFQSLLSGFLDPDEVSYDSSNRLGFGTMATVYRGRYCGMDVACKVYRDHFYDDSPDEELRNYASKEVSLLRELRHPCIVSCIGSTII